MTVWVLILIPPRIWNRRIRKDSRRRHKQATQTTGSEITFSHPYSYLKHRQAGG